MKQFVISHIPEENVADVQDLLSGMGVKNISKIHDSSASQFILLFRSSDNNVSEVLSMLLKNEVGRNWGIVDILSVESSTQPEEEEAGDRKIKGGPGVERMSTDAIMRAIDKGNCLNFDFICNVVAASMIAAAGLATNNPVVVVASMLVSPLMGPILAFSLAPILNYENISWNRRRRMIISGLVNECIGLAVTVLCGVLMGLAFLPFGPQFFWPTGEMASRGTWVSLVVGVVVAAPSGAAVALAVTGGGVNSLVGVAISASLLPPAVNSGMALIYGLLGPTVHPDIDMNAWLIIAAYSFTLTMVNIAVITVTAMTFFKIKQVGDIDVVQRPAIFKDTTGPSYDPALEHSRMGRIGQHL